MAPATCNLQIGAWCLTLGTWPLALGACHLALGVVRLCAAGPNHYGAQHLVLGTWRLVPATSCLPLGPVIKIESVRLSLSGSGNQASDLGGRAR